MGMGDCAHRGEPRIERTLLLRRHRSLARPDRHLTLLRTIDYASWKCLRRQGRLTTRGGVA
jgi:hypothetical protein